MSSFHANQRSILKAARDKRESGQVRASVPASAPVEESYDPAEHTVSDVEAYVAEDPSRRDDVLALERAGRGRSTLIEFLTELGD